MGGGGAPQEPKDEGEKDGGEEGKQYKWEQKDEEVLIRFALKEAAVKKEIKVTFKPSSITCVVKGETLLEGKLAGPVYVDDCTWCTAEKGMELQLMLAKTNDTKWSSLLA